MPEPKDEKSEILAGYFGRHWLRPPLVSSSCGEMQEKAHAKRRRIFERMSYLDGKAFRVRRTSTGNSF